MSAVLHADGLKRCHWPGEDPLYVAYHDEEWGVPEYDDRALFEKLILDGFRPEIIAKYDKRKIEALMQDAGIVRNRAKIEGTVKSAQAYLDIMKNGPGFSKLLWSFVDGKPKNSAVKTRGKIPTESAESRAMSKELIGRGFKFVGPTIVYAFMQATGMVNDHLVTCHRHATVGKARKPAKTKKKK
jgi:DNA-3-methyladenine glycosylase I